MIWNVEAGDSSIVSAMDAHVSQCKKNLEKAYTTAVQLETVRKDLEAFEEEEKAVLAKLTDVRDKCDSMRQKYEADDVLIHNTVTTIHESIGSLKRKMCDMDDNNKLPTIPSSSYINVYSSPVRNCGGRTPERTAKKWS